MATITKPPHKATFLIANMVVLLAFIFLCSLGFWQFKRADLKETLVAQKRLAERQPPLNNQSLLAQTDYQAVQFHPVRLHGSFDNDHPILLDNKTKNGQVGYVLYLPFWLDAQTVVLVERDFVKAPSIRAKLPRISPQTGDVTIEGYCNFAYRNPFFKKAIESTQIQWPLRVQQIDTQLLTQLLGKKVVPMLVESKLIQDFPTSPSRHRGYAAQWFGLAFALLVVYYFVRRGASGEPSSR